MSKMMTAATDMKKHPPEKSHPLTESPSSFLLAVGLHVGLLLIATALIWQFFFEPARVVWGERFCILTFCCGALLAANCWITSASLPRTVKPALLVAVLIVTITGGVLATQDLVAHRQIFRPGRIERSRFVHDGLGLSFRIVPQMQLLRDVTVADSDGKSVDFLKQPRLRFGQEATIFRMALPNDPEAKACPIVLTIKPFRFSRRDLVVYQVLNNQTHFSSQAGERLARPVQFHRLANFDVIDFELVHVTEHFLSRYVYLRSGSYLVCFVLRSPNADDRRLFDEFVSSIQITGRATRFDQ